MEYNTNLMSEVNETELVTIDGGFNWKAGAALYAICREIGHTIGEAIWGMVVPGSDGRAKMGPDFA